jgi:hypothetical protein
MLRPKIFAVVALTNGRGRVTWSCRVIIREECAYEQRSKLTHEWQIFFMTRR